MESPGSMFFNLNCPFILAIVLELGLFLTYMVANPIPVFVILSAIVSVSVFSDAKQHTDNVRDNKINDSFFMIEFQIVTKDLI